MNLEQKLLAMLDRLALGATFTGAARAADSRLDFFNECVRNSTAGARQYIVTWGDNGERQFCEHVTHAKRIGRVAREQYLRRITINGETQYVFDPALLARFGFPDDPDAKDMAELNGYPHYPFALDSEGRKIPALSSRHPRPMRHRHPHPHTGRNGAFEKSNSPPDHHDVATAALMVGTRDGPAGKRLPTWQPEMDVPPYARNVSAPVPPRVTIPTPSSPLAMELREKAAILRQRGPLHNRPMTRDGRPMAAASIYVHAPQRVDDPQEKVGNR